MTAKSSASRYVLFSFINTLHELMIVCCLISSWKPKSSVLHLEL